MDIKLTEIVRAMTISLKVSYAPMTALPLIKDAFAKLATDLEELMGPLPVKAESPCTFEWKFSPEAAAALVEEASLSEKPLEVAATEQAAEPTKPEGSSPEVKRRGRPPKKAEQPVPEETWEPTPLEQAIAGAAKEDKEPQGEIGKSVEPATTESTPTTPSANTAETPVTDRDLQSYCVKVAQHYGGAAKVYDLCKPYVGEGAVARPSNIKGDDLRWQFIRAVEADSGVRYLG